MDSRVLRTLVKYNTLAAKIPTIDLYDSMVLQTMLSGSTEPTYCEAPIAQVRRGGAVACAVMLVVFHDVLWGSRCDSLAG